MTNQSTDELLASSLGHEIKAMRVKRGMTREQVAADAEISVRQLGKIERGERGQLNEVWRVARALGVTLSWLVSEAEVVQAEGTGPRYVVHSPGGDTRLAPQQARIGWVFDPVPGPPYSAGQAVEHRVVPDPDDPDSEYVASGVWPGVEEAPVTEPSEGDLAPSEERNDAEQG